MASLAIDGEMRLAVSGATPCEQATQPSVWEEVACWLALLPTLFITVNGRIQTEAAPVAFRFTAMEEDSLGRRLTRLTCSALIIFLLSTKMRGIIAVYRTNKLLLSLPAIALVSVLWSQNPRHSLVDAFSLVLTTLFAVYLYLHFPGSRIVSFLTFVAFISLFLCAISVVAFPAIGIDSFQQNAWRGIFGQRNNCAAACTFFLAVALHAQTRGLIERIIRSSVILLSLIFIVMSGSRTGWLLAALAVSITYGLRIISRVRSLDRLLLLLIVSVPIALTVFMIGENFKEILATLDKDPTLTQRTIIWAQVLPSIVKHPFLGYGYSAFWAGLNGESMQTVLTTGWMEGQAQDGYLDILLQLGLLGLAPFLVLFLRGFGQAVTAVQRRLLDPSTLFAMVLLPLILVENIGESSLLLPLGIPWFYALFALLTLSNSGSRAEGLQ
jgi:exopolysaccharide production protein ExoQ